MPLVTPNPENLAIAVSAIIPNFIGALTIVSFCNGFFMLVQGFFVRKTNIPDFWRYWGHYWSYQKYPFEALVKLGFEGLTFDCGSECQCMYRDFEGDTKCSFSGNVRIWGPGVEVEIFENSYIYSILNPVFSHPVYKHDIISFCLTSRNLLSTVS
jgi:hypothetical protein